MQKQQDFTGTDFSKRSIDHARKTAAAEGLSIRYINESYLELELDDRFDLVMMIMCDFCALSPEALEQELSGCGLDVEKLYADVAGSTYNPAHTEFAVVARKQ